MFLRGSGAFYFIRFLWLPVRGLCLRFHGEVLVDFKVLLGLVGRRPLALVGR